MKVKEITYNWHQVGSTLDRDGAGENWCRITVGISGVIEIIEHLPQGEGDKFNYLVKYHDGSAFRIFNPCSVEYFKPENTENITTNNRYCIICFEYNEPMKKAYLFKRVVDGILHTTDDWDEVYYFDTLATVNEVRDHLSKDFTEEAFYVLICNK